MPYTPQKTWTTEFLTVADMNAYLRDNGRWVAHEATGGAPMCRLTSSTSQTITSGSTTALNFNTEDFDIGGMHSTVTNTSRITVPSGGAGVYMVGGAVRWQSVASATRRLIEVRVNGGTTIASDTTMAPTTNVSLTQTISTLVNLTAGDYVELMVYQETGAGLDSIVGSGAPRFWAIWQGRG